MTTQSKHLPAQGFDGFGLGPSVLRGVAKAGFTAPRPIQVRTIPAALEGRDIMGLAQTGTGKTAAFVLPILERLLAEPRPGPRVLVVAPTRELATQIEAEFRLLGSFTKIRTMTIFGGVGISPQVAGLRDRPHVLIACPGRLLDLMNRGAVRLDGIETLVLDEADHMFDMGFLPDVRRILAALPAKRQNLLFSATMPPEIRRLAKGLLDHPHIVEEDHSRPAATIEHAIYPVDQDGKFDLLQQVLSEDGFVSAIVFTRTKHRAKRLAKQLDAAGHKAVALQGNMSQSQRERAMKGFRGDEFDVMVATDIAARGLDIDRVSHVVNFDTPSTPDAYTHRIGRTGRAERSGRAFTFVTEEDHAWILAVERKLGAPLVRVGTFGPPSRQAPGSAPRASTRPAAGSSASGRRRVWPPAAAAAAAAGNRPPRRRSRRATG